jgi:UDP-3-O-[3-hydroxymyristoyl] glucosamine N-acyltransferase
MDKQFTLAQIAQHIGAELVGESSITINKIATLSDAQSNELSFIVDAKYLPEAKLCQASAIIVHPKMADQLMGNKLIHANPYLGYAKAAELFKYKPDCSPGIHPTAVIGQNCQIDPSVAVGPYVVVGDRCIIGANTKILAGTIIGDDCTVGANCELKARVTFYADVKIGDDCIIHSGAVIGADGFGNAKEGEAWYKIPQLGGVRIDNDVEIGANTTIDRGAIGHTMIKRGVRIDNLVQIAHNVEVGAYTAIAACTGIAGSTKIGEHCLFAGMVGVNGHITIGDRVVFTGMTMVTRSIAEPGIYSSGTGLFKNSEWRRIVVGIRNLSELSSRVNELEKKLPPK